MVEKGVAGEAGVREVLPLRQQTVFSLNNKSFPILTILTFYPQKAPCNASVARIRGVYVSLLRRKLHWFCTLCVDTVVTRARIHPRVRTMCGGASGHVCARIHQIFQTSPAEHRRRRILSVRNTLVQRRIINRDFGGGMHARARPAADVPPPALPNHGPTDALSETAAARSPIPAATEQPQS